MTGPPLDLAVLRQQTADDDGLTREVLKLFLDHAPADLEKLVQVTGYERRVLAHRLVGSARGVGAVEVARLAASVEAGTDSDVPALSLAVAEALRFVESCLAGRTV
jgi:HPt (histidine-containing phosphotransfer) domain-containing protein